MSTIKKREWQDITLSMAVIRPASIDDPDKFGNLWYSTLVHSISVGYYRSCYICCFLLHLLPKLRVMCWFLLWAFFNFLVFILPKCIKYQKDHTGTGLLKAYICVIFSSPIGLCNKLSEDLASKRQKSTKTGDVSETDTPLLWILNHSFIDVIDRLLWINWKPHLFSQPA